MEYYKLLSYISTLLGLLLAFVYWNSRYRYFFAFQALSDMMSLILWEVFSMSSQTFWIPIHYLIILSVDRYFFIKYRYYILGGLIPIFILNYFSTADFQHYFVFLSYAVILILFLRYFIISYFSSDRFNVFFITMVFNQAVVLVKFLAFLKDVELGLNVYFAAVFVQNIISIFLIFLKNWRSKDVS